jgi:hypothetical protein
VEVETCEDTKLLATEFCPNKTKTVYLKKPNGGTAGDDGKYALKVTKECTTHTEKYDKKPVITLNGSSNITLNVNEIYTEQGATATDELDGNLTSKIKKTGSVNTLVAGTYVVTYSVANSVGQEASVTRTVIVKAAPVTVPTKPTITLNGSGSMEVTVRRNICRPSERRLQQVMEKI